MRARMMVPALIAVVVVVVPVTLIAILVRAPYTHANLLPGFTPDYTRTEIAQVGAPVLYAGPGLAVRLSPTTPLEDRGKTLLVAQGCSGCHGMNGQGGVVAPPIIADLEILRENVRKGPGGMPVFSSQDLTDYDLTAIAVYLQSAKK